MSADRARLAARMAAIAPFEVMEIQTLARAPVPSSAVAPTRSPSSRRPAASKSGSVAPSSVSST